jgi:hypothetical protein
LGKVFVSTDLSGLVDYLEFSQVAIAVERKEGVDNKGNQIKIRLESLPKCVVAKPKQGTVLEEEEDEASQICFLRSD